MQTPGGTATAEVVLTVQPVDDAPTVLAGWAQVAEDDEVEVALTVLDPDSDEVTLAIQTAPAHGTAEVLSGHRIRYTPHADHHGPDLLTVTATADGRISAEASLVLSVTPVDDPPFLPPIALSTEEDTPIEVVHAGVDPEGDPITLQLLSPPTLGSLDTTTTPWTYHPAPEAHGTDSFVVVGLAGGLASPPAEVTVTVAPAPDAPTVSVVPAVTQEDTPVPLDLTVTDPDGDDAWIANAEATLGTVSHEASTDTWWFTPDPDVHGTAQLTLTATDGTHTSPPVTVPVVITSVPDAPVLTGSAVTLAEDVPTPLPVSVHDADGDALTGWIVDQAPTLGTLDTSSTPPVYTPQADAHGTDTVVLRATDGTHVSEPLTVDLTITPVNAPPRVFDLSGTGHEDGNWELMLIGFDVEGDPFTFVVVSDCPHGELTPTPDGVLFEPTPDWHGTTSFQVAGFDGQDLGEPAWVTLELQPHDDPPEAFDETVPVLPGETLQITLPAHDPDGAPLAHQLLSLPDHAEVSLLGPVATLTVDPDAPVGLDDGFTFRVGDGTTWTEAATLTLQVVDTLDGADTGL